MSSSPSAAGAARAVSDAAFDFEQLDGAPHRRPPSLGDAAARARTIVAAAEAEADRIRAAAAQQGYAEGFEAGRMEARTELAPAVNAMGQAVEAVRAHQAEAADSVEGEAVSLALEIAEKVVAGALAVEPERVLDVIRGALRALVERERLVIMVNPDDLALVNEGIADLAGSLGGIEHVDVQEERRVQRGGAVVRTTVGDLDARISTKLERAREAAEAQLRS